MILPNARIRARIKRERNELVLQVTSLDPFVEAVGDTAIRGLAFRKTSRGIDVSGQEIRAVDIPAIHIVANARIEAQGRLRLG